MQLKAIIGKINKIYGDNVIGFANDLEYGKTERLSSGSAFLDWALGKDKVSGVNGWPMGRIVELFGPESSGKSLISLKTIAEAQDRGYKCAYLDCENTYDKDFAEKLGVDNSKLLLSRESQGEKLLDITCDLLSNNKEVRVVVFDSLASMIPTVEVENSLEKQQMAPMARLMSKGLRKLTAANKNSALIIFINQLRVNPGVLHGNPEYTPGGRSLKFYSSVRVDVRRGDWIFEEEDKKKKVGQVVRFKVVKNKTDIPYKDGYFKFMYAGDIDKIDELISLGILNGKITRRGAWYDVGKHKFNGKEKMEAELKNDKVLLKKVRKIIEK